MPSRMLTRSMPRSRSIRRRRAIPAGVNPRRSRRQTTMARISPLQHVATGAPPGASAFDGTGSSRYQTTGSAPPLGPALEGGDLPGGLPGCAEARHRWRRAGLWAGIRSTWPASGPLMSPSSVHRPGDGVNSKHSLSLLSEGRRHRRGEAIPCACSDGSWWTLPSLGRPPGWCTFHRRERPGMVNIGPVQVVNAAPRMVYRGIRGPGRSASGAPAPAWVVRVR